MTAEEFGIETCVLRPARDDDWEGLIRHVSIDVIVMKHVFRDAVIELIDGRCIPVPEHGRVPLIGDSDTLLSFEGIVNGGIQNAAQFDNKNVFIQPNEPLWHANDAGERVAVARLLCRREQVEGARQEIRASSTSDCVFVKQTPNGEMDERLFFEFSELNKIAEAFRERR